MSFVLDASVTLNWYLDDERTAAADALLMRAAVEGAVVPALWRLEVANGLQMAVRRGRLDPRYRDAAIAELGHLPITVDPETDAPAWGGTLHLADRCQITLYDAAYLELARRLRLPLATLDAKLGRAAATAGVDVLGTQD